MAKVKRMDNSPENVAAKQAAHPHYKWFDIFEADGKKEGYVEPNSNESKSVTIHFTLGKKLKPVFIEPALALGQRKEKGFNHFAIEADKNSGGGPAQIYLPKDVFKTGQVISWEDMARILELPISNQNSQNLKRYKELMQTNGTGFEKPYDYEKDKATPDGSYGTV